MKRIYKRSDRISVVVDDITIQLAPLTFDQKNEIQQSMLEGAAKKDLAIMSRGVSLAMKYAVRGIAGVECVDGSKYELAYDDAGNLTTECVDDLLNLEQKDKLVLICSTLSRTIPGEFTDGDGAPLKGVSIVATAGDAKSPNA